MRLHTSLSYEQVEAALSRAKNNGKVDKSVQFVDTNAPERRPTATWRCTGRTRTHGHSRYS